MTQARAPAARLVAARPRPRHFVLASLILLLVACAGLPLTERLDAGLNRLEAELDRLEARGFVGQIAVVHGDEVLLLDGYGPMAIDDPVGRYLDGLDRHWSDVPIENLLTHTAGLPAEIHNRNWTGDPRFEPIGRDELIQRVNHFPPDDPPGEAYNYSNITYNLLAAVVERISGRSWEAFLRERLLEPANIDGIGLLEPDWAAGQLVRDRADGEDRGHGRQRQTSV